MRTEPPLPYTPSGADTCLRSFMPLDYMTRNAFAQRTRYSFLAACTRMARRRHRPMKENYLYVPN